MSAKSAIEFANWLKKAHPRLYNQAAAIADEKANAASNVPAVAIERGRIPGANDNALSGLAAEDNGGWFSTFIGAAATLGGTYLNLKNQRDQLKINLQRAQIGLAPIDVVGTPILTARVELPPDTIDKITQSAGMNINKILIFGGLAVAAFFFLK